VYTRLIAGWLAVAPPKSSMGTHPPGGQPAYIAPARPSGRARTRGVDGVVWLGGIGRG
jgi:hypothetical protein